MDKDNTQIPKKISEDLVENTKKFYYGSALKDDVFPQGEITVPKVESPKPSPLSPRGAK